MAETVVTEKKPRVKNPLTKFVFSTEAEARTQHSAAEAAGKNPNLYSMEPGDGKTYFIIEFSPRSAIGRLYEYLGAKPKVILGKQRKAREAVVLATPDAFVNQFTTMSPADRQKIIDALGKIA